MKMIVRKTVIIILSFLLVLFSLGRDALGDGTTGETTLTWTMPTTNVDNTPLTDLAGVKLYYGVASGTYTTVIDVALVTTYAVTNLTVGTTYYFVATAYDAMGNESSYSNEVFKTIIAGGGAIPVPTGLQISANGGTVTVSWDKPNYSSIGGYQIQRGPIPTLFTGMYDVGVGYSDNNTPCVVNYVGCSRKQFIFNGVVPGTYFWRIGAYDISSQFGAYSDAVWIFISSDAIPAADVTLFTATQYGTGVRLTWTNPTNPDFAGVQVSFSTIGNNGPWVLLTSLIGATPGSKEAYNHLDLPAGKTYYYKIQVIDTSGNQTNTRYAELVVPPTETPPPVEIQDPLQTTAIVQTAPPPETKKKKEASGFGCGTIKNDRSSGGGNGTDISIFALTGILLIFAMRAKLKNKLRWRTS